MIDFSAGAGGAQRRFLGDLLHGQDRADRNVVLVTDVHDLELGLGLGPLRDRIEEMSEPRQPRRRGCIIRIGPPFGLADQVTDRAPDRRLSDEVGVGVRIGFPTLALENPSGLSPTRIVAGARYCHAERNALAVLAVFRTRPLAEPLRSDPLPA